MINFVSQALLSVVHLADGTRRRRDFDLHRNHWAIVVSCCICLFTGQSLQATDVDLLKVGVYAGAQRVDHRAGFSSLPVYINQFASYRDTNSLGWDAGIVASYRLSSHLSVAADLGVASLGTSLSAREFIGRVENGGQLVSVYSDHLLTTSLNALSLRPTLRFQALDALPLQLEVFYGLGAWIQKSFTQTETLSEEAIALGFRFTDAQGHISTVREKGSGSLASTNLYHTVGAGLRYELLLNRTQRLGIRAQYLYNLSEVVRSTSWNIHQLSLGLSYEFVLKQEYVADPIPPLDTLPHIPYDSSGDFVEVRVRNAAKAKPSHKENDSADIQGATQPVSTTTPSASTQADTRVVSSSDSNTVSNTASSTVSYTTSNTTSSSQQPHSDVPRDVPRTQPTQPGVQTAASGSSTSLCVAILFSSESKVQAERVLKEVQQSGIPKARLQTWVDAEDKVRYYRVQVALQSDDEFPSVKSCLIQSKAPIRRLLSPVLKCD